MNVTYYGHACFSVEIRGKHLLFDPFITPNPLAKNIDLKKVPADCIFISHGHEDHVADAVKLAKHNESIVIANFEVAQWLEKKHVKNVRSLNPGGSFDFGVGRVKSVNAIHSSSMPDGSYGGVAGGFVIESTEGNFYYSGDTALTCDMKLIGEGPRLNFAALCLGGNYTMGVDDAIRAAAFVNCDQILGVHYDTFPEIRVNHVLAKEKFKAAGRTLHLLQAGDTVNL
jgi:L-ascorbate metabolism protein UlaG (beta-lactamase superfamily)